MIIAISERGFYVPSTKIEIPEIGFWVYINKNPREHILDWLNLNPQTQTRRGKGVCKHTSKQPELGRLDLSKQDKEATGQDIDPTEDAPLYHIGLVWYLNPAKQS